MTKVTVEKKGGVQTPLRLFLTVWEIKGLERKQIAEREITITTKRVIKFKTEAISI